MFRIERTAGLLLILLTFSLMACSGGRMDEEKKVFTSIKEIPALNWENLSKKRIYFGHQSVGVNIIDGVKDLMKENSKIRLNIVEIDDPQKFNVPMFAHSRVGKNDDPKSKCNDFKSRMEAGLGENADIAFFKFCFVDVIHSTDIEQMFSIYKETISILKEKYPKTTFIHVTVPLTTPPPGILAQVKKVIKVVIGRPIYNIKDNINREYFNEKLRNQYEGKDPIYDLAKIGSTLHDGTRATFQVDDKLHYRLASEYTYDGGHLNEIGRRITAEQLLILLAGLSQ